MTRRLGVLLGMASLLAAACSSSSTSSSSTAGPTTAPQHVGASPAVLHMAYSAPINTPDPDIFYFTEGNSIVTNVYDDLVQYAHDNSFKLVPGIAQSWDVSADGKSYTFHLHPNVKFHDGTTMTSSDVEFSFKRRAMPVINSGMAYLTGDVSGYATPDPNTLVVTLKSPDVNFLSNLASPYGIKPEEQSLVMAHQVNGDMGQDWLKTHDAGTGPYQISTFDPSGHYVLTKFDGYWGTPPQVTTVDITVIPSAQTQLLEFQDGQLQLIIHGLTASELDTVAKNPKFAVDTFVATYKLWMDVNMNHGIFADQAARTALNAAVNRALVTSSVYGKYGSPGKDFYIPGEVPAGSALDDPAYDPSQLAKLVPSLPSKKVTMVYTTDDSRNQQAAEIIQTELQAAGLDVTLSGVPLSQGFTYQGQDPKLDPDLMVVGGNPDSGNADDYARPFVGTVGVGLNGSLNDFHCSVPGLDDLIDQGAHAPDLATSQADYVKAGEAASRIACQEDITQIADVVAIDSGYGGVNHQVATVWSIPFADLTLNGS